MPWPRKPPQLDPGVAAALRVDSSYALVTGPVTRPHPGPHQERNGYFRARPKPMLLSVVGAMVDMVLIVVAIVRDVEAGVGELRGGTG